MRVEFEFDKVKIESLGYSFDDLKTTMKKIFAKNNLPCVIDTDVLAFADNNLDVDYSNMWLNITGLVNTKWFMECASACRWYDEEEPDEVPEDVLSQAWKLIKQ